MSELSFLVPINIVEIFRASGPELYSLSNDWVDLAYGNEEQAMDWMIALFDGLGAEVTPDGPQIEDVADALSNLFSEDSLTMADLGKDNALKLWKRIQARFDGWKSPLREIILGYFNELNNPPLVTFSAP